MSPTPIQYDRSALVIGNTVSFDSGVQNAGNTDSGVFNIRWLVDGRDVGVYGSHAGVPAGATVLNGNSAFAWVAEPGRHTITFVVDVDNYIDETNESNNRWTIVVRMP